MKKYFFSFIFSLCLVFTGTAQNPPDPAPAAANTSLADSAKTRTGAVKLTAEELAKLEALERLQKDLGTTPAINGPVDYNNPKSFFDEGVLGMLEAGAVSIIAMLGGFIPGLRRVNNSFVRSGVVIFAVLTCIATFRFGALTEEMFTLIAATFLPNFAGTNFVYNAFKNLVWPILKRFFKQTDPQPPVQTG